ncbi:Asp-tRNA(Asn)/Glu-tRNA(Gln) amidotransferase subunit GatB [Chitinophaga nivalis]|uniref:Aspartyl/glutamyl-tRNA(Asn/Gln) amidotransferase subunit B n=1 Tax=Chitinophaga nivalis TaxID=2991709 RepID=A0ABT3IV66_9BACT|nr:Asp-tRNA(Asn)/Glu-tRNA(Gln) amidotransferase subunit GatB [Chitinophaga nivalis]MCW3462724.1 Asp-tRNA(Asn)/Glu-tRNA(Gln) amidotransferase subunit GatB [Chitinophaga nivalis]MCW3487585.1 Asp-tRNA(Asn)/Glu-tRNA(Gln) amidotransferase subunit GatB [Chitinophaga nivalis]
MSDIYSKYETVIGLEVHAQLLTASKLFCNDSAAFGGAPNTHISAITLAHPGTLPRMNRKAAEYAIKLGLACHCEIEKNNYFARKNYFYPDLPKGYQVSQHTAPICKGGYVAIVTEEGARQVQLNRIHLEEDAGKLLHDQDPANSYVDYNRAGVPLVEIVTEPDMHSSDEAYAYLTEMRRLVRYLGVCDGNMEEGSMRCDANISVRLKGTTTLGTKVEVKNMNSIRNVKRAIDNEVKRQIDLIEAGGTLVQETRSFDAANGSSFSLRSKEEANDYRYFPEPDLAPFRLTDAFIEDIRASLPALPEELIRKYTQEFGLPDYDARVICDDKATADYFESLIALTPQYKAAANWILGPVKSYLNEHTIDISRFPVTPAALAALITLTDSGKVSFSIASSRILPEMIQQPEEPLAIATRLNLLQDNNADNITPIIEEVLAKYPDKVAAFKGGKKGLMALFVGEVMKLSKGKADPRLTNELLAEKLKN